jgi:ferredoxin--NADP+ reductase
MILQVRPELPVTFLAGQFMSLGVPHGDTVLHRAYSIASAPSDPLLEFFIERVPNGNLTPKLWELGVGDALTLVSRPAGVFTLDEPPRRRRHLFVATVTGAAPFISILREERYRRAQGIPSKNEFLLLHGASTEGEYGPYVTELTELSAEGWFHYVPTVSRVWETAAWSREVGRVEDILRKYSDTNGFTSSTCDAYVCGHPEMVTNAEAILRRAGFHAHDVTTEIYFKAKTANFGIRPHT